MICCEGLAGVIVCGTSGVERPLCILLFLAWRLGRVLFCAGQGDASSHDTVAVHAFFLSFCKRFVFCSHFRFSVVSGVFAWLGL